MHDAMSARPGFVTSITSTLSGVTFNLGVVFPDVAGGVGGAIVEFYDARSMPGAELNLEGARGFGPLGQFVASYTLSTLLEPVVRGGLALRLQVPAWHVDAGSLNEGLRVVQAFVAEKVGARS
jgi:hypothetical protein